MDKPQILCHVQESMNHTLFDARWIPRTCKFVVLGTYPRDTGSIHVYELGGSSIKAVSKYEKQRGFRCGTFGASGLLSWNLATGDHDGRMQIWNLEKADSPVYSVKAHGEIINTIDGMGGPDKTKGAAEIVTGSRDGLVKVWDPRQKDEPVATMSPEDGEAKRDCWTVAFGDSFNQQERCIVAGYDNGDVKLFDLRNMSVRWEANLKNGVCSLEFDRKDIEMNKLVATTLEGKIRIFDMRTQHPTKGFSSLHEKGHDGSTVWSVRHLPQNRDIFMTCGGNGTVNLWKYTYPSSRKTRDGEGKEVGVMGTVDLLQNSGVSTQLITGFDWSPDKQGLAVCTAVDQTVRVVIVTKLNLY